MVYSLISKNVLITIMLNIRLYYFLYTNEIPRNDPNNSSGS